MIAEATPLPWSVPDAAQAVSQALDRVRMSQRRYAEVRRRASPAVVTRARTDWGLAVLEWVEASEALAAAEDSRGPGRAAADRGRRITVEAGPARGAIESAWRQYQQVRRNGAPDQIAAARAGWREALVGWFQALAQQRAAEDGQHAQQRRAQEQRAQEQHERAHEQEPEQDEGGGGHAGGEADAGGEAGPAGGPAATAPPRPDARPELPPGPVSWPAGRPRPGPRRGPPGHQPLGGGWMPAKRASQC